MTAVQVQADTTAAKTPDKPRVRPAVHPTVQPAPVREDPSGFGLAPATAQRTPSIRTEAAHRPVRSPKCPPRWPHIALAVAVPAAGVTGFCAAVLASTLPIEILTYTVVGGVVVVKVAGPVRAVAAVIAAAVSKVGPR